MVKPLVSDTLWETLEPLLPDEPPRPKGGRPRVSDRACLTGILFVLKTGIPWEWLPQEMGCGVGMTCWRRLRDWHRRGLGPAAPSPAGSLGRRRCHRLEPGLYRRIECPGKKGGDEEQGEAIGKNPTDRGKPGTKTHLITDRQGLPLVGRLTGANRQESIMFEPMIDAIPPIRTPSGQRRKRPTKLHADKAYDNPRCHAFLRQRRIQDRIARIGIESKERLGRYRWVIERTFAWLHHNRRLQTRYERRDDIHQAFLTLACARLCCQAVERLS